MDYYTYNDYEDYIYNNDTEFTPQDEPVFQFKSKCLNEASCISVVVVSTFIFLLGFFGNALVIWISGFKMKKTVNITWYLSLAISDFVFCAFLPLNIASTVMETWVFGRHLCKLVPSIMFLNMFSSIFLLVVISIDRCVSVMFPVWAQNHRTVRKASVVVVLAWVLAITLSAPSLVFRDLQSHMGKTICFNNYTAAPNSHKIVVLSRFLVGFVVPFLLIVLSYSVIILKLRNSRMTKNSKPFRVMSMLVAAFFVCWLPYHIFVLLELNHQDYDHDLLSIGLKAGTCMAAANSFMNPVLYVFMGNDFKRKFCGSLLVKMRDAMADEDRTKSHYLSSRTSSVDGRVSTHI